MREVIQRHEEERTTRLALRLTPRPVWRERSQGFGVTGGGLHGKDLSKADVSVNIWCYLESIRTGREVTACCSIGDETVCGIPYRDIVEQARLYIQEIGGFERFSEWGLIRPKDE